jgi:hypothetical protein
MFGLGVFSYDSPAFPSNDGGTLSVCFALVFGEIASCSFATEPSEVDRVFIFSH